MSILIRGLCLPQKGKVKMLVLFDDGVLLDNEDGQNQWRAIEVPPHGRFCVYDGVVVQNDALPTIIPEDGGADNA